MNVLDVLFNPGKFFKETEDFSIWVSLLIVALNGVAGAYIALSAIENIQLPSEAAMLGEVVKVFAVVSAFISTFIGWALYAGVIHIISSLLGGVGDFAKSLKVVSLGYIPALILSPISYYVAMSAVTTMQTTMQLRSPESMVFGLAISLWQLTIWSFGISRWRNLSTSKALISCAVPVVATYLLSLIGYFMAPKTFS
jgi:hypothetical protein